MDKREELIETYGEDVVNAYEVLYGNIETSEEAENFQDAYVGTYDSKSDFGWTYLEDIYEGFASLPDFIKVHVDMKAVTREMFLDDFQWEDVDDGRIAVFYRH